MIALIAALFVAVLVIGFIYFLSIILGLALIIGLSIMIGMVLLAIVAFVVTFFAAFYYLVAKKPKTEPGTYKLEEVKGKRD